MEKFIRYGKLKIFILKLLNKVNLKNILLEFLNYALWLKSLGISPQAKCTKIYYISIITKICIRLLEQAIFK